VSVSARLSLGRDLSATVRASAVVVWRACSSLRVLGLDGGEQLGLPHQPPGPLGGRGVVVGAVAQEIGDGSGDGAALGGGTHAGTGSACAR